MPPGKKRSLARKIIYILISLLILAAISSWIFFTYYLEDSVNDFLRPKLQQVVNAATNGHFRLKIGRIIRKDGMLYCTDFELLRVRYDSSESGFTIKRLTVDTVWLKGLNVMRLLRGYGSFMSRLEMRAPNIYMTEVPPWDGSEMTRNTMPPQLPDKLPVISFDSIVITDIRIFLPETYRSFAGDSVILGASARLADFRLDSLSLISEPLLYSKHVGLEMPKVHFNLEEGVYGIEAGPIHAQLTDSLIAIDTITLSTDYSEEEFAAREKHIRGRMDVHCANIAVQGFDMDKLTDDKTIALRTCSVGSWSVNYYSDKRRPRNPHPEAAMMPNDAVHEFHMPVNIDSLILSDGRIKIRERAPGSKQAGVIAFDHVRIIASPYSTDSSCGNCGKPTKISVSALFLGEAQITATASSELQHPGFDMDIDASVGKFSAKRLNSFLIPNERKEVTAGTVEGGTLKMNIRNGVATTTVTPHYKDLSMKILPKEVGAARGLIEGLKTFVANTFVLRSNNIGATAISGTTTYRHKKEEEFLQFIWIALRKSLGKVIGGFD